LLLPAKHFSGKRGKNRVIVDGQPKKNKQLIKESDVFKIRNPNGYGSVYKLKGKRRKPWAARVTVGWDEYKKQIYKFIGWYADKPSAIKALSDYYDNPVPNAGITLDALYMEWSKNKYKEIEKDGVIQRVISIDTENNYRAAWKYMDAIKDMEVRDIRTNIMQKIIDDADSKKSRSTTEKIKALFIQLFDYALQNDIVRQNYAKHLVFTVQKERVKRNPFTDLEIKAIENAAADGNRFAEFIMVMIYTGFRLTEFITLTPFSYDAAAGTLTGGIKTEAGYDRVVPVHKKIKPIIEKWLSKKGQVIFCKDDGTKYSETYFRDSFKECISDLGIDHKARKLTPHSTRHTFASMLDKVNATDKVKELIMGHTDYKMTKKVYIHKQLDDLKSAIDQLQ
jgi:integrase